MYIRHPWESGMDNSPAWDGPLERIHLTAGMVPPYQRVDNKQVDPDQRPTKFAYDRYVYLVSLFYKAAYNETDIRDTCPFLIQDVAFNSIWARVRMRAKNYGAQLRYAIKIFSIQLTIID